MSIYAISLNPPCWLVMITNYLIILIIDETPFIVKRVYLKLSNNFAETPLRLDVRFASSIIGLFTFFKLNGIVFIGFAFVFLAGSLVFITNYARWLALL